MATDKLFSVVGIACKKGEYKVRWANDLISRVKMLTRDGQLDIRLVELSEPVTKLEAVQAIIEHEMFQDDVAQQAIDDFLYSVNGKQKAKKVVDKQESIEDMYAEVFADLLEPELA